MPNKPGPISSPGLKQVWGGDFRAQKWPLEGVDTFILGGQPLFWGTDFGDCPAPGIGPVRPDAAPPGAGDRLGCRRYGVVLQRTGRACGAHLVVTTPRISGSEPCPNQIGRVMPSAATSITMSWGFWPEQTEPTTIRSSVLNGAGTNSRFKLMRSSM